MFLSSVVTLGIVAAARQSGPPSGAWIRLGRGPSVSVPVWRERIKNLLPPHWRLVSYRTVSAPSGWQRQAGGNGMMFTCNAVQLSQGGGPDKQAVYRPFLWIFCMPTGWEGASTDGQIRGGQFSPLPTSAVARAGHPADYLGHTPSTRPEATLLFATTLGHPGWATAGNDLVRKLSLVDRPNQPAIRRH